MKFILFVALIAFIPKPVEGSCKTELLLSRWNHFHLSGNRITSVQFNDTFAIVQLGNSVITGDLSDFKGGALPHLSSLHVNFWKKTSRGNTQTWVFAKDTRRLEIDVVQDQINSIRIYKNVLGYFKGALLFEATSQELKTGAFEFSSPYIEINGPLAEATASAIDEMCPPYWMMEGPELDTIGHRSFRIKINPGRSAVIIPKGLTPLEVIDSLNGLTSALDCWGYLKTNPEFAALGNIVKQIK